MHVFKNKAFAKWADKQGLKDAALLTAAGEINAGLYEADLGGQVFKKRVPLGGRGKRSSLRTLLAYRQGEKAFFVYGFAKNAKSNITDNELKALKFYANTLLSLNQAELNKAIESRELIEVVNDG